MTRGLTDVFVDLWGFCYEAYSTFMEKIRGVMKMFHSQLIKMREIAGRMNAAITSLVFGLISMIVAFISTVQLVVIIVIVVVGIMLLLQIIMFFLFLPISSLILTISAVVMSVAVVVATTVAAVMVGKMGEGFQTGACFVAGTQVATPGGGTTPIERIELGQRIGDGGIVTAIHRFVGGDALFNLFGVQVTGDHLVWAPGPVPGRLIPVAQHPEAVPIPPTLLETLMGPTQRELWCLTTSSRTIPVMSPQDGRGWVMFADWEEIPASNMEGLRDWHAEVWRTLNGADSAVERPTMSALTSEAALSGNCRVAVQTVSWQFMGGTAPAYRWTPIESVQPGDRVAINHALTEFSPVVGVVQLSEDQVTRAMVLPGADTGRVSAGVWLRVGDAPWSPADSPLRSGPESGGPLAVIGAGSTAPSWRHLYTAAGSFVLEGGWHIRDASDVGLEGLAPLVGRTVLKKGAPK
jgi:hypothetical protein